MIVLMPLCAFGEEGGMCVFVSVDVRPCPGGSVIVCVEGGEGREGGGGGGDAGEVEGEKAK